MCSVAMLKPPTPKKDKKEKRKKERNLPNIEYKAQKHGVVMLERAAEFGK